MLDLSGVCFNEHDLIDALRYTLAHNTTLPTLHIEGGLSTYSSRLRVEQSMPRPFTLKFGPI